MVSRHFGLPKPQEPKLNGRQSPPRWNPLKLSIAGKLQWRWAQRRMCRMCHGLVAGWWHLQQHRDKENGSLQQKKTWKATGNIGQHAMSIYELDFKSWWSLQPERRCGIEGLWWFMNVHDRSPQNQYRSQGMSTPPGFAERRSMHTADEWSSLCLMSAYIMEELRMVRLKLTLVVYVGV